MQTEQNNLKVRRLTLRQSECAELAADGLTSKEIARRLGISPSTVDNHINAAMLVLQISKRSELSHYFPSQNRPNVLLESDEPNRLFNYTPSTFEIDLMQIPSPRAEADVNRQIRQMFLYAFFFVTGSILFLFLAITIAVNVIRLFG